ncbi:MAG: SusC/RagA family TonB-linked outer membrane protein [Odoribacteraceae bacterium]|jgi:TonB-linked SusC/RagA family outer membrane protein|nr:SusC/RagA family TonB-linked outer membrane protein [Odoribacteraceae bacterium]
MQKKRFIPRGRDFLFLFLLILAAALPREARAQQEEKLTLGLRDATLKEIINEIKRQSSHDFVYSDADLSGVTRRDAIFREASLDEVLSGTLRGTGLTYSVNNQTIVIRQENRQEKPAEKIVTGVVTDAQGIPLPGVAIRLVGTSRGVATNVEGKYSISVPNDGKSALRFSCIGTVTREINVGEQEVINVQMEEDNLSIDEVVVTGYFERSKNSFTGAFTSVKREELRAFGNVSLLSALQLIDPSFKIRENNDRGSDPNTLPDFFVRGESSFMGNSNIPTFIVDGNEVSLQQVFDMDLDRIESLNILKDASATVHYGSRAANGVVVIETRRPASGKFSISYSNRTSLSAADLSGYDLLNAREKLEYEIAAGLFSGATPLEQHVRNQQLEYYKANIARGVNTDWLAQPTRNALSHSHALYAEGGTAAVVYGLSVSYGKNGGVIKKSSRENLALAFDLTYRTRGKLSIRNSFSYGLTNVRNSPYGSFSDYAKANPYNAPRDEKGNLIATFPVHRVSANTNASQYTNPLYNANLPYKDQEQIINVTNNLSVDYFITPELRYKGSLALTKSLSEKNKYTSPEHTNFVNEENPLKRGSYTVANARGFSYNMNSTLTYSLVVNKHNLYTGVGLNVMQDASRLYTLTGTGFLDERFNEIWFAMSYPEGDRPNGAEGTYRMVGWLGNINYSYDNRYFVDLSGRVDGSSKYGKDRRFSPLWSTGVGWNINNETFMEGSIFDRLTLRASIGITGNQQFDPYMAKTMLQYSSANAYYQATGAVFMGYGNKLLEWQQSTNREIGLDVEAFKRRLTFRFDYYNSRTDQLLLPVSVPPSLGFTTYTENFGEQSNRGFEFDVNAVIIRKPTLDWAVNVSGTRNRNRIEKISNVLAALNTENHVNADSNTLKRPISMYKEGDSRTAIKVVRSLGINPASGKELFLTRDNAITEKWDYRDKITAGDTEPSLEGNIATNLIWKQFSLNILFRYAFGGQVYNTTLSERVEGASPFTNADARVLTERWRKPGDVSFYKNIADRNVSYATSRFVQDNNYLELRNISISYRFGAALLKQWGISNARVGLNTSDLFHLSTVKRERGIDYPFARQFTFSLNLNF